MFECNIDCVLVDLKKYVEGKKNEGKRRIEKNFDKIWWSPFQALHLYYSLVLFSVAPSWPSWLQLGCLCLFSISISNLFDLIIKHMGRLVKCVLRCAIIVISSIAIIITEKKFRGKRNCNSIACRLGFLKCCYSTVQLPKFLSAVSLVKALKQRDPSGLSVPF